MMQEMTAHPDSGGPYRSPGGGRSVLPSLQAIP